MGQITITLPDNVIEVLDDVAEEDHDGVRSHAVHELIDKGLEYDELKDERDRLRAQLAATNRRVDQHQELVEYVREEREMQRSRRDLERQLAGANILTRWKWKITGVPVENSED